MGDKPVMSGRTGVSALTAAVAAVATGTEETTDAKPGSELAMTGVFVPLPPPAPSGAPLVMRRSASATAATPNRFHPR